VHAAVVDRWHTDVVVISKFLSVDATVAVGRFVVVVAAVRNDRHAPGQGRRMGD